MIDMYKIRRLLIDGYVLVKNITKPLNLSLFHLFRFYKKVTVGLIDFHIHSFI